MGIAHLNDKITESGATGTYLQRHRFVSDKNNKATHDDHQNDWSLTMINLKVGSLQYRVDPSLLHYLAMLLQVATQAYAAHPIPTC